MRNEDRGEPDTWAAFVTAVREAMGLGKSAFGRRIGVDRGTVHRWEIGRTRPTSPEDVLRFADATGVGRADAMRAAGLLVDLSSDPEPPRLPQPPLDADLLHLARRLADPDVPAEEKATIRGTVRYLADRLGGGDAPGQREAS